MNVQPGKEVIPPGESLESQQSRKVKRIILIQELNTELS